MYLLAIFLFLFTSLNAELIQAPKVISTKEIEALPKTLSMTWNKNDGIFHFETKENDIFFEIFFSKELPETFTEAQKKLFKKTDEGYFFTFHFPSNKMNVTPVNLLKCAHSLTIAEPRFFSDARPFQINKMGKLVKLLKNKKILFYTGAGVSKDAGIPTMKELDALMGFEKTKDFASWVSLILNDPKFLSENIKSFHTSCFTSRPTKAHQALSELAILKNTKIVTENLDHLHQKTGYQAVPVSVELKGLDALSHIDFVICMGLSRDNKGFLARYKELNPRGRIISIDLKQPSYLDDYDVWFEGDVQEIIPDLLDIFQTLEH